VAGGLDEISLAAKPCAEVHAGKICVHRDSGRFCVARAPIGSIRGGSPAENAAIMQSILSGESGARRDIVVIIRRPALVAPDSRNFLEGAQFGGQERSLRAAQEKLAELKEFTNRPTE